MRVVCPASQPSTLTASVPYASATQTEANPASSAASVSSSALAAAGPTGPVR